MLDPEQRVQVWNRRAEGLWGLRPDEAVESHFLGLDIGLPSEQLAPALRAVLGGASERETRELQAVNRRGRTIVCAATVLPLVGPAPGDGKRVRGAIVPMENRPASGDGADLPWIPIAITRTPSGAHARGPTKPSGGGAMPRAARPKPPIRHVRPKEASARRLHEREERVHEAAAKQHERAAGLHAEHEREQAERERRRADD